MGLTDLVEPGHAVVGRLVGRLGDGGSVQERIAALRAELSTWEFLQETGPSSYERTERLRAGNCVDLAALFCAAARRVGARSCHVVLGSWPAAFPAVVHAWVLLSTSDDWLLVDPRGMTAKSVLPQQLEHELTVLAIFDDTQLVVTASDRTEFWRRNAGEM